MASTDMYLQNPKGRVVAVTAEHGRYLLNKKNSGYTVVERSAAEPIPEEPIQPPQPVRRAVGLKDVRGSMKGKPALILGRGPSLGGIYPQTIRAFREDGGLVIGVNDLIRSHGDVLSAVVFCDESCFSIFKSEVAEFPGVIFAPNSSRARAVGGISTVPMICGEPTPKQFASGKSLRIGRTSALPALELAVVAGCDPIWIAGVDLALFPNGSIYGKDARPCPWKPEKAQKEFDLMLAGFKVVDAWARKHGRRIYRTSNISRIPFPVQRLELKK